MTFVFPAGRAGAGFSLPIRAQLGHVVGRGPRLCYATPQEARLSGFPAVKSLWVCLSEPACDEQRRATDASLAESKKGPYYGPFKSGAEIAAFMKKPLPGARPSKSNKSR